LKRLRYFKASLGAGRNICQPEQTIIFISFPGTFLGVTITFQLMLFRGFLYFFPEGPTGVTKPPQ